MKKFSLWFLLVLIIIVLSILSITMGEYDITFKESILAVFGIGEAADISIVQDVRIPRLVAGLCVGATLSLSGIFIRSALKNPLADSGVLGIQTGATAFALFLILYVPTAYVLLPVAAFIGGMLAFTIIILISQKRGLQTNNIILSGVAVNAFFSAIIGLLTVLNPNELRSALTYLNGSLANITTNEAKVILIYSAILIVIAFFLIPILKILRLDDVTINNLGINPAKYRLIASIFGVLLATVTVAFVGVIAFIGIIIPSISRKLVGSDIKDNIITSILLGSIVIVFSDFAQKIIFAPVEIPVGLIVGIFSAPVFLFIVRRQDGTKH